MGTTPTRLEVLKEARRIAESVGAVKDGDNFFEREGGSECHLHEITSGNVREADLCGVCIAGATILAEVILGGDPDEIEHEDAAGCHAVTVANGRGADLTEEECAFAITALITDYGTPYVVEVIDAMIAAERDRQAVPA